MRSQQRTSPSSGTASWHGMLFPTVVMLSLLFFSFAPGIGCKPDGKTGPDGAVSGPDGTTILPDGNQVTKEAPGSSDGPTLTDSGDPNPTTKVPCPPTLKSFQEDLWEPIFSTQCLSCHTDKGAAKNSRFVLLLPSVKNAMTENLKRTMKVATIEEDGASILLSRPMGTHKGGHPGGALVSPGTQAFTALQTFINAATGVTKTCSNGPDPNKDCSETPPGPQLMRRLTRREYDNTIQDLFGFPSKWGAKFVVENVVEGFNNNAAALTVTPLLADQIRVAAEEIAAEAIKTLSKRITCASAQNPNRTCVQQWIKDFGKRAYRGPLLQGQVDALLKLYDLGAKQSFERGIELTITGMLQSPFFLYRQELGTSKGDGYFHLSAHEIASSLSYLFWGTMPDAELFKVADSGALTQPEEIAKQAKRLLASPRSRFVYEQFFTQWLLIQRISSVPKDAKIFASFTPAMRVAMAEEAKRFVWHIMEQKSGTLDELLTANLSVINKDLATLYGVKPPEKVDGSGYGVITFPTDQPRGGLLTLGSVLTVHGRPDSSSPIHRGVLVRERMLCQHLPPPPANVDAEPPGLDPNKTTRERYTQHSKDPTCAGCHNLIDPIGFGFEQFDGIGRFRKTEGGRPIDAKGEVLNAPNTSGTFDGLRELSDKLAKSPDVHQCFTLQWMRWAYGMKAKQPLSCALKSLSKNFSAGTRDIKALLVALTQTKHFRMRLPAKGAPTSTPEPPSNENPPPADAGPPTDAGPPPPPPNQNLKTDVQTKSKWNTGYCNQINVTNQGNAPVSWSIELEIQGKITQLWNAVSSPGTGNKLRFSGVEWNRTLKPSQSAQFGFCASL